MAATAPAPPTLTLDQAKAAVDEVSKIMEDPASKAKIDGAKAMAQGQDPSMLMMMLMPIAAQLLGPVLSKYGFTPDPAGIMAFFMAAMNHKDDAELKAKAKAFSEAFVPPEMAQMLAMMGGGAGLPK
mmetsp:Transcript_4471/g.5175  ORF Transcript_4471/g.5175 Transcript_4471/m.5175 type:complete len:127 (-) Transcript_4471:552-932(-)|eukprot:CAMPEP_0197858514 /NCGR_PEP_ID=MMETSP1438-20131217/32363_1 /TAXON_ID=1461541 /ORGANISM="Pterosperma sp., Strain CCMP1384" /LENGTH=126 /DNA_ID=CAMNT_0043474697 /DNA_START=126 /DNA_END=506 /DNA_ORIENTATION=-